MKDGKLSKLSITAKEKLAREVEQCGPVLLSNVPVSMSGMSNQIKLGYALVTFGMVSIRIALGTAAWVVRTKL